MELPRIDRRKTVTIPQHGFDEMLERAAQHGARHALSEVGLDGPTAAHDIRELRTLLEAWRGSRRTAWQTAIKVVTTGTLAALLVGASIKLKLLGGGQ